ncbi:hypothetical protein ACFLWR_01885 [Chloroflexota bacterium]
MNKCGWCGYEIKGKPVSSYEEVAFTWDEVEVEEDVSTSFLVEFCCYGCAWAFGVEIHRLYGMTDGNKIRSHLMKEGLPYPPGKPRGAMSCECHTRIQALAIAIVKTI